MPKKTKFQNIGKFRVATKKNEFYLLTNRPERKQEIRSVSGKVVGNYKLTTKGKKLEKSLKEYINRIYDDNKEMLNEKGITKKSQFREYLFDLMYETRYTEEGKIAEHPRSVKESLRILSRTRAFTSKEELALENMKNIVSRGKNPELRAELAQYFGNAGGQIQRKKLKWHPPIRDARGRTIESGYYSMDGVNVKMKFRKKKKGKYNFDELFEIIPN